jgi:hypothetical protein
VSPKLSKVVDRFNEAATELQKTDFHSPRTPNEWEQNYRTRHLRDYDKLLKAVTPMTEAFASANAKDREQVLAGLNQDALHLLSVFAAYMPVLAVRRESPELITEGLTALAIMGAAHDVRDLTFYLAALHHSATKLGIDTERLFGEIASLTPSVSLQDAVRTFPSRPPEVRGLSAFWLRETLTDVQFDLVQDL